ncbi:putative unusual protein kinase regulating ubiquinone biosynthesis (AarF/ABC1/UbiB family) [Cytobacillus oceanisediminis]|uniref:Putative unusual protein kinase regulating ubiquinone biosynthesis (AarF/ABC1/UbiB family) n=1 Tax=Cytobacillus oceanisediminis TaxID=665099 RepID=A0A2V3ADY8_9BACI|nr:AarF/UbiB family protein [Cytobacillus oceanisediminis]PWW32055.1 putative unusual protein kinase regulating ubiquinone biosynthesis (AarF/ABC1/UbiB family) [Cytobacillus oceanisediminis]
MKTKNKLFRMYKVLSLAFSIFVQIYWYKWTRKPEAEWEKLWSSIGKRLRKTLFELEGLLIKVGQFISIRSDLLPDAFIREIQDLTDNVPPSEWSKIHEILIEEWGFELSKKVLAIERDAIASASIGEVYKGVLQDGSSVAIKVQRPEIQSIVQTDFRTLSILIWFADHFVPIPKGFINLKVLFQELKQVIERELDFTKEKETLLYFKNRYKESDDVRIPAVYPDLCTSKVLVMEWVEGRRLTDIGAVEQLNISRPDLARRLMKIFIPQWLEPGMFHADPHPGNVLVSREGHIILLDFGMAGEISKKDAAAFQSLIESFLAKNYSKAVECLSRLGFLLPEADPGTIERLIAEWVTFDPAQLKEMDFIALKLELNDLIAALPIQVPTRFVFLGRSFMTIEGIIRNLTPDEELLDLGKPVFTEWLNSHGNKWSFIWRVIQSQPLFKIFHSAVEFLETPSKLEQLKESEQRREFQFAIFENRKKQLFQLLLIGIIGVGTGYCLAERLIWQLSAGLSGIALAGYCLTSFKLEKWLKYMPEKRR